jgi:hypothetical protein
MAGRAQAANLTGMLGQIAETVGEMGKASDWTHNNIRDYSAPDVKDGSFESLTAYADWAQRNGKQEIADQYRALALAQQQKNKKGEYAQAMGAQQEKIRHLIKGIGALGNTIDGMPDTSNNQRRPMAPAPNGGFRRPPGMQPQQPQPQGNNGKDVLKTRLQEMNAQLGLEYQAMNQLGADNVQFGGVGTEGSVFERTIATEEQAAKDAALQRARNNLALAREADATAEQLEEEEFKVGQTGYIRQYDEQFLRVKQAEAAVRDAPNAVVEEERRNYLAEQTLALEQLEAEWQDWGDTSQNKGAYDAAGYAEKSEKDYNDNITAALERRKKELAITAAQRSEQQAGADLTAISSAAQMAAEGRFDLTEKELEMVNPMMLPKLQSELERHRENDARLQTARLDGTVADDVLAYAEGLAGANPAIDAALKVYRKSFNPDSAVTSISQAQLRAAEALTNLTNTHRNAASTTQEAVGKSASVMSWTKEWREFSTDRMFTHDLMDGISEKNLTEFNNHIETFMGLDGASVIKSNEDYVRYAIMARDAMDLKTDQTNLGEVIDNQDTAQTFSRVVGEVTEAEYQRIIKEEKLVSEEAARRRAAKSAETLVDDMRKFLSMRANDQQRFLQLEVDHATNGRTIYKPRFLNLFNGLEGSKSVLKWMKDHPGQQYSYKGFMDEKKETK